VRSSGNTDTLIQTVVNVRDEKWRNCWLVARAKNPEKALLRKTCRQAQEPGRQVDLVARCQG
jgi:hypothetical protein